MLSDNPEIDFLRKDKQETAGSSAARFAYTAGTQSKKTGCGRFSGSYTTKNAPGQSLKQIRRTLSYEGVDSLRGITNSL